MHRDDVIVRASTFDPDVAGALARIYLRQRSFGRKVHRAHRRAGRLPFRRESRLPTFESPHKLLRYSGRAVSYVQWRRLTLAEID